MANPDVVIADMLATISPYDGMAAVRFWEDNRTCVVTPDTTFTLNDKPCDMAAILEAKRQMDENSARNWMNWTSFNSMVVRASCRNVDDRLACYEFHVWNDGRMY